MRKSTQEVNSEREQILACMEILSGEHESVSSDMIAHFFKMRGVNFTSSEIGNNLRVLKGMKVVKALRSGSRRSWKLTGRPYEPDEVHPMLIPFPQKVFDLVSKLAKLNGVSRTAVVVDLVWQSVYRKVSQHPSKYKK